MKITKLTGGGALVGAVALTFASVLPAYASVWNGDTIVFGDTTDGTEWSIYSDGGLDHSYVYIDGQVFDRVICESSGLQLDGSYFEYADDMDITTDTNGDQVVTGTGTFSANDGDVDATVEYRAYAAGDLLRTTYVLTNNTGSAITVEPSIYEDPSDNSSDSATTSSGDLTVGTDDYWYTTFDSTTPSVVYSKFWGAPDYVSVTNTGGLDISTNESSETVTFGTVTIAAGASFQWIVFHSLKGYALDDDADTQDGNAIAAGQAAVDEFGGANPSLSGSERLTYALDTSIASNWFPAQTETAPDPALAETGADLAAPLGFAVLALFAGAAVVIARRRAQRH